MNQQPTDVNAWLSQTPDESYVSPAPNGGKHIPIEALEQLLDDCTGQNWSTRDYHSNIYFDNGVAFCFGSIVLVLKYQINGQEVIRTFVGASNFALQSILPLTDWNATLKSYCVKNAASDAGRKLGRELNKDLPVLQVEKTKKKADIMIKKQMTLAVLVNDQETIDNLNKTYSFV